jgi:hypothetical protein
MMPTPHNADPRTAAVLVQGVGSAAAAVEDALADVMQPQQPWHSLAFIVCDPDTRQAVTSATWLAHTLQEQQTFTVGVALRPCDAHFNEAVDLLLRVPAEDATAVLRPLVGAAGGESILPFDVTDLRWHFRSGGEAIADRQTGITSMAELREAMNASLLALRRRGALTDDGDWLVWVLQHGPKFSVGKAASFAPVVMKEAPPQLVLFGTFRDTNYGDEAQLIALARVCGGEDGRR